MEVTEWAAGWFKTQLMEEEWTVLCGYAQRNRISVDVAWERLVKKALAQAKKE